MAAKSLADVAEIDMGQSPPGETCNTDGIGLPLLNGPTEYGPHHPFPTQYTTDPRRRAQRGDVLFCVRGSTTGRMNWADQEYAIGRGIAAVRHRGGSALQPFVRAVIEHELPDLLAQATGSTFPNVSKSQLGGLPWPDHPIPKQRAIAHILGALDDKIQLNRRMKETLEAIARALFKSWFVDFDPARAKMNGRWQKGESLPGLPTELYDLFPDRMVESELGEVPQGWRVDPLKRHVQAVRGLSYKGKHLADEGIPMHNLNSVLEGGGYKYEGIKYYEGEHRNRHLLRAGDLVVANTEQGHDRLLIGYAALVPKAFGEEGIFSHHLYRVLPEKQSALSSVFLCYLLNSGPMQQIVSGYANGTTVNMLPGDALELPKIVVPPEPLVAGFSAVAEALLERREGLVAESNTLERLRDTLLPKLISGELRVPDAEQIVERAPDA